MKISATVTLKKDVLDPQGKVVSQTLKNMGYKNVINVRQGKYFEIELNETDKEKAKKIVEEFSKKLLREAQVAVSPGLGFGEFGEGYVRFSLIENEHRSRQAIRNIKRMFRQDGFNEN